MNKKFGAILAIIFVVLAGFGIYFYSANRNTPSDGKNYEVEKTATSNNTISQNSTNTEEIKQEINDSQKKEEQISTFSTKIYSTDSARQNNINITCNTLNETIVKNGETFSFCNTVGPASTSKGYQKADIFDKDGNKKKGLGGGNCQISSTLYNAVLSVPSLVVVERHAHSNYVPYIERGKDAAVAYGSYDFKFRNDSGNNIKILSSSDGKSVTATLIAIK